MFTDLALHNASISFQLTVFLLGMFNCVDATLVGGASAISIYPSPAPYISTPALAPIFDNGVEPIFAGFDAKLALDRGNLIIG